MLEGPLAIGDSLWWAPHDPKAFERVIITGIHEAPDGTPMVKTQNVRTLVEYWNREIRVRQLAIREPKRPERRKG
jgi:hypothetical protein